MQWMSPSNGRGLYITVPTSGGRLRLASANKHVENYSEEQFADVKAGMFQGDDVGSASPTG
jgi:hypothetical protein